MSGLKICFFVHECVLEAGHTRAMIEVLRHLPKGTIEELHLIYYEGAKSSELFPDFSAKVVHHKVPCKWIFPFLFKAIFFQVYCFFLNLLFLPENSLKIGIGTACLNVNFVNVQFLQSQWEPYYFKDKSFLSLTTLYKKILFLYFRLCENYLYRKDDLKILALSNFVREFLIDQFHLENTKVKTIYSSVNLDHFPSPQREKLAVKEKLVQISDSLVTLDLEKPIYLFVGAFQRKGLEKAIQLVSKKPMSQLIVIGKPEVGTKVDFPKELKIFHIPFTKEISSFYEISDVFVFPTIYEPFGLVVAEAASMGNIVYVPKKNVGASEILGGIDSIKFLEDSPQIDHLKKPLSLEEKTQNAKAVRERLADYSWKKASNQFLSFIGFS